MYDAKLTHKSTRDASIKIYNALYNDENTRECLSVLRGAAPEETLAVWIREYIKQ